MEELAKPFTMTICTPDMTYEALATAVPPVGTLMRLMKKGTYKVVQVEFVGRVLRSPCDEAEYKNIEAMEPLIRCVPAAAEDDLSEDVRRRAAA
jgi:hypothetical protein